MLPPSATAGRSGQRHVLVSAVSVIEVLAAVESMTSDSKLPPMAESMLTETEPASTYTSSVGAATADAFGRSARSDRDDRSRWRALPKPVTALRWSGCAV